MDFALDPYIGNPLMPAKPYENQFTNPKDLTAAQAADLAGYKSESAFLAAFKLAGYRVDPADFGYTVARSAVARFLGRGVVYLRL